MIPGKSMRGKRWEQARIMASPSMAYCTMHASTWRYFSNRRGTKCEQTDEKEMAR